MDSHGVIKTTKVLITNAWNSWITNKVMLCNVLNLDIGRITRHFVFSTVNRVVADSVLHFLASRLHASFFANHGFLSYALQVNINTAHLLSFCNKTLFSSHDFKRTQLVACSFDFFVLSNLVADGFNHHNAVFVEQ